jgi:hypothetical protein
MLGHGGPVGRAHVDRHGRGPVTPPLGSGGQPRPGIAAGTAFDLPSRPCSPVRSTNPVCQRSTSCSNTPVSGVQREARLASAGLINSQRHHRFGFLGEGFRGVVKESRVDHRPGQARLPRGLCHRPALDHRASPRLPKPAGHPLARGNLGCRLGERGPRTRRPRGSATGVYARPTVLAQEGGHHVAGSRPIPSPRWPASHTRDTPAACPSCSGAPPGSRPDRVRPDRPPHRAAPTTTSYRSFTPVALHDRLPRQQS